MTHAGPLGGGSSLEAEVRLADAATGATSGTARPVPRLWARVAAATVVILAASLSLAGMTRALAGSKPEETVAFAQPFSGSVADALAHIRQDTGAEVYADRRWASTRVFVAQGRYKVDDVVDGIAAASLLVPRQIGDMTFLAGASEPAAAAGPLQLALGDEARARLMGDMGVGKTDLSMPAEVAAVYPPQQMLSRRRVLFDTLGPQQRLLLQSLTREPLDGLEVEFVPGLMFGVDPHKYVLEHATPPGRRSDQVPPPAKADQAFLAFVW